MDRVGSFGSAPRIVTMHDAEKKQLLLRLIRDNPGVRNRIIILWFYFPTDLVYYKRRMVFDQ